MPKENDVFPHTPPNDTHRVSREIDLENPQVVIGEQISENEVDFHNRSLGGIHRNPETGRPHALQNRYHAIAYPEQQHRRDKQEQKMDSQPFYNRGEQPANVSPKGKKSPVKTDILRAVFDMGGKADLETITNYQRHTRFGSRTGFLYGSLLWNKLKDLVADGHMAKVKEGKRVSYKLTTKGKIASGMLIPEGLSSEIDQLVEAGKQGEDVSFALHDALLDAGRPDLAEKLA